MPYYVYVMQSLRDQTFYKGFTENYLERIADHNAGLSQYTSRKVPWKLIYVEEHATKRSALIREKGLKKCKAEYFNWLRQQPTNLLNRSEPCHGPG